MATICNSPAEFRAHLWALGNIARIRELSPLYLRATKDSTYLMDYLDFRTWRLYVSRNHFIRFYWRENDIWLLSSEETEEFYIMRELEYGEQL